MTLKDLIDMGFSPTASMAIIAVLALYARQVLNEKKQNRVREEWHTETRSRVDDMQGHIEECNDDRLLLKAQVATLKERTDILSRCPIEACPSRPRRSSGH